MKVSVDVELTPEEMRRLFGLPDLSPIQNLVIERVTGQIEKGLDQGIVTTLTRAMISGGLQSWDAYQKLVTGILSGRRPGDAPTRSGGEGGSSSAGGSSAP